VTQLASECAEHTTLILWIANRSQTITKRQFGQPLEASFVRAPHAPGGHIWSIKGPRFDGWLGRILPLCGKLQAGTTRSRTW